MATLEELAPTNILQVKDPDMYDVILLNDDFTTMEFVVELLRTVFFRSFDDAKAIMLEVHNTGEGIAGTYVYDIAVSKANKATEMARAEGFPLRLNIKERI